MNIAIHIVSESCDHYNVLLENVELTDIKEKLKESVTEPAGYWSDYYVTSSDWKSDNAIEGIIVEMIEESQQNDEDFM